MSGSDVDVLGLVMLGIFFSLIRLILPIKNYISQESIIGRYQNIGHSTTLEDINFCETSIVQQKNSKPIVFYKNVGNIHSITESIMVFETIRSMIHSFFTNTSWLWR